MLAGQDLLVILVIALIVFGPKKLPELMKTIGKTLGEVKKATEDVKESIGIKELEGIKSNLTMDLYTVAEKLSTSVPDDKKAVEVPASMGDSAPTKPLLVAESSDPAVNEERVNDNNEKSVMSKEKTPLTS